jgi:hypothetical protein
MLAPLAGFHSTHQAGSARSENDDVVFLSHAGMSLAGLPSYLHYGIPAIWINGGPVSLIGSSLIVSSTIVGM